MNNIEGDNIGNSASSNLSPESLDSAIKLLFGETNKTGYSAVISICIWLHRSHLPGSNK
jgi:hypothetical protein